MSMVQKVAEIFKFSFFCMCSKIKMYGVKITVSSL